jgi:hypothetical protein
MQTVPRDETLSEREKRALADALEELRQRRTVTMVRRLLAAAFPDKPTDEEATS